jgi:hypothetical protein
MMSLLLDERSPSAPHATLASAAGPGAASEATTTKTRIATAKKYCPLACFVSRSVGLAFRPFLGFLYFLLQIPDCHVIGFRTDDCGRLRHIPRQGKVKRAPPIAGGRWGRGLTPSRRDRDEQQKVED